MGWVIGGERDVGSCLEKNFLHTHRHTHKKNLHIHTDTHTHTQHLVWLSRASQHARGVTKNPKGRILPIITLRMCKHDAE